MINVKRIGSYLNFCAVQITKLLLKLLLLFKGLDNFLLAKFSFKEHLDTYMPDCALFRVISILSGEPPCIFSRIKTENSNEYTRKRLQ